MCIYIVSNCCLYRGCKACGREEVERGCNGEGRIQGGIATVPGFGWWPIKAYRPCPGFVASGGRYRRRGQTMDEVAFGRTEPLSSINAGDKAESRYLFYYVAVAAALNINYLDVGLGLVRPKILGHLTSGLSL